jgi:hypothetical protein
VAGVPVLQKPVSGADLAGLLSRLAAD